MASLVLRVRVTAELIQEFVEEEMSPVGDVVSIFPAAGEVQVVVFPALSEILTEHDCPEVEIVQFPEAFWIPLPPVSEELERVAVTG